jgi:hypothetical protein
MPRDLRGKICPFSIQAKDRPRIALAGAPAREDEPDATCATCRLEQCAAFHDGDCTLIVGNHYLSNNVAVAADAIKSIGSQIVAVIVTVAEQKLGVEFQRDNVVPLKKQ